MAVDLEADPVGEVPSGAPESTPVASDPAPSTPSALEDMYDFGPPDETPATPEAPVAEVPAETPATSVPAATAAAPEVSPALAQRAAAMGFTPEALTAIRDPIALETAVRYAEQAAVNGAVFARNQLQQQFAPQQQAPAQQPAQLPPPPQAPAPFDEAAIRRQCDERGFDAGLTNLMVDQGKQNHASAMMAHGAAVENHRLMTRFSQQDQFNNQSYQYMQQLRAENQALQATHQRELIDRDYGDFVKSLPESQQKLVSTPQSKAQIHTMANAILIGLSQSGQAMIPNAQAFEQAAYAVLGKSMLGTATEAVRQEVRTHQNRSIARPSSSRGAPPAARVSAEDRAEAAGNRVEEFFRNLGMPASAGVSTPEV